MTTSPAAKVISCGGAMLVVATNSTGFSVRFTITTTSACSASGVENAAEQHGQVINADSGFHAILPAKTMERGGAAARGPHPLGLLKRITSG